LPSELRLEIGRKKTVRRRMCVDGRFFADILLTPLEATRIRLVSDPKVCAGALILYK